MKIRSSFVANSSSTSFTFVFKGNTIEDFYKVLEESDLFPVWNSMDTPGKNNIVEVEDFINAIKELKIKRIEPIKEDEYRDSSLEILSIDDKINQYQKFIEELQKSNKEHFEKHKDNEEEKYWILMYIEQIASAEKNISRLKQLKESGLNSIFDIQCGDNHGDIEGDPVGEIMDYGGRELDGRHSCENNLFVITEQCR